MERIDRLITDYSQMIKDEATLSREKMKKISIKFLIDFIVIDQKSLANIQV